MPHRPVAEVRRLVALVADGTAGMPSLLDVDVVWPGYALGRSAHRLALDAVER